ncbi:MAG: ornithine carbamoyltransferase [Firmicutes bacterium]|nr:ornithine carbamoyltransferase [Bacillota bacterium]
MDLRGRDFLKLLDYTEEEILYLINVAMEFKRKKQTHEPHEYLRGKNIALIFEKDSTRTRCSFEVAAYDLGMHVTYLGPTGSQIGKKETIKDTARVLAGIYDGIEYRGFGQDIVEELAKYSKVPVWNGLTNEFHPTQMLADLMTTLENFGHLKGLKFVFMGDARNNVGNSLMIICSKLGLHFTCCAPEELFPNEELVEKCKEFARISGGSVTLTTDAMAGTKDADVLYTDVWVSMGEKDELWERRIKQLSPYQVNQKIIDNAKENVIFLHCLPSFHNIDTTIGKDVYEKFGVKEMEVTDEVFESSHSRVMEEAENRMHTIKAVIYETLK